MQLQRQKFLCKIILYLIVVFTGYSVRSLKHFAASSPLTSLTELRRESGICAVGAGSRVLFWSPFKFSSCPARIVAEARRQDRPTWWTFECSSLDFTSDCSDVTRPPDHLLSQASLLQRCLGRCCKVRVGSDCYHEDVQHRLRLDFVQFEFGFAFGCSTIGGQYAVRSNCQTLSLHSHFVSESACFQLD